MSLRSSLIRLAHSNPEMQEHLLPLLKEARVPSNLRSLLKGEWVEVKSIPVVAIRYYRGSWGAIMENGLINSYSNLAKFRYQLVNAMQVPQREAWRAVEELEAKVHQGKTATTKEAGGTGVVRKLMKVRVRIMSTKPLDEGVYFIQGKMNLDFGDAEIAPLFFKATVRPQGSQWTVISFNPRRAVSGAGAEKLKDFYESALVEVLNEKGNQIVL